MVTVLLHPALQDPVGDPEVPFDLANTETVFNHQADGLPFEVWIVPSIVHEHTSCSR